MRYSEKFKEQMVAKLLGPEAWSACALGRETGVSHVTLSRWRKQAILGDMTKSTKDGNEQNARRRRWTAERKVEVVMRAQTVNEGELGALLRREGLHEEDLERFRQEVMQAAAG